MMDDLDLRSLACVDALARTLRFHVAARSCALSPAAFGRRIQQVEDRLGRRLFARSTRRVTVAPGAEETLARIRRLLEAARVLGDPESTPARTDIVLATRFELGMSWLFPARRAIARALPGVVVHLRFGPTDDVESAVLRLRADAGVLSRAPATRALDAIELHREDYDFVAAPRLLAQSPFRRPADAREHVLVDADDALPLFSYLRRAVPALRFDTTLLVGTIAAVRAAILEGEGVGVLPRYFVRGDLERGRLVRLSPKVRLDHDYFRLLFRADHPRRETLARIAAVLRDQPLR